MWMLPQPPPATGRPAPVPQDSTALSGVEVVAPNGVPKVVATFPAAGAAVAPGNLALMVRFDHRMAPGAWSYGEGADMPACLDRPRLLKDEKTFVLLCTVGFNKSFSLTLNRAGKGFADIAQTAAAPFSLAFTTGGGEPTVTIDDALKAAGLSAVDDPIVTSDPRGGG